MRSLVGTRRSRPGGLSVLDRGVGQQHAQAHTRPVQVASLAVHLLAGLQHGNGCPRLRAVAYRLGHLFP